MLRFAVFVLSSAVFLASYAEDNRAVVASPDVSKSKAPLHGNDTLLRPMNKMPKREHNDKMLWMSVIVVLAFVAFAGMYYIIRVVRTHKSRRLYGEGSKKRKDALEMAPLGNASDSEDATVFDMTKV